MKFHQARKVPVTRATKKNWDYYVASYSNFIRLDKDTIKELKKGLKLGNLLELPKDLAFSFEYLSDLIATESFVRPFKELM